MPAPFKLRKEKRKPKFYGGGITSISFEEEPVAAKREVVPFCSTSVNYLTEREDLGWDPEVLKNGPRSNKFDIRLELAQSETEKAIVQNERNLAVKCTWGKFARTLQCNKGEPNKHTFGIPAFFTPGATDGFYFLDAERRDNILVDKVPNLENIPWRQKRHRKAKIRFIQSLKRCNFSFPAFCLIIFLNYRKLSKKKSRNK